MRLRLLLAAAAVLAALLPATASAALPTPKTTTIVPGKSIGGVAVGMSVKRALAIWGPGSLCTEATVQDSCNWIGTDRQGAASFNVVKGKVVLITISTGRKGDDLIYAGPLQKWKTRKKVRLGVTAYAVFKAYPKVHGSGSGPQLGSGNHTTTFQTSSGRIYQINVGAAL
jgi:hypothetical protein